MTPTDPPPPSGPPRHTYRFFVHQKVTPMVNRFRILAATEAGEPGALTAFAEQKRLKLKEEIDFFDDEGKTTRVFAMKSRQVVDMAATTDVFDEHGQQIGCFQKDFGASLLRSTWHLHYGGVEAIGQERSAATAIIRRVVDVPLRFHFDFTDRATGQTVLSVQRQPSLRDRYAVTVSDSRLDHRLAAAMAVGLDIFQGR